MSGDFTEWLRARSDEQLRTLVAARPELITPVPAHVAGLAARATTPSATGRALDRIDRFRLAIAETMAVLPEPQTLTDLHARLATATSGPADSGLRPALREAVEGLRDLGLVYGPDTALRLAPGVREALEPPAGLGPPAAEAFRHHAPERLMEILHDIDPTTPPGPPPAARERLARALADEAVLGRLIEGLTPQARSALDELAWGPPSGRVHDARRDVRAATARSPIDHLLAFGLLAATGEETVTLPREVALFLRGGRIHRDLSPAPPELGGRRRDRELADRTAAGQAFTITRTAEELCEHWSVDPPGALRTGGLAVRDLRRTAQFLDLPEHVAALVAEVAYAAGLIASGGPADEWLPTSAYDTWRVKPVEDRWALLAAAWLGTDRVPGLVGERDERDRLLNALHPDLRRGAAVEVRTATLKVLAAAPPDLAVAPDSVTARLDWDRPRRRGPLRDRLAGFTLREAELLGLTGLGVLSAHGRALVDGQPYESAARLLAPLLPEPVDHVLLQADLTAVAPGPLTSDLGRWLALAADIESKGGATVYRFGDRSVRRALDAGQTADELLAMLERHSATPVPQPLRYLVSDVARRHGRMRIGTASAYVRCDDPAVLDEVMADRRAAPLRLRRLAPTVVVSRTPRATLVDSLRAMGYSPVAESGEGDVLVTRADSRRADAPAAPRAIPPTGPEPHVVAAAVRAVRAGDAAHLARSRDPAADGSLTGSAGAAPPRSTSTATLTALKAAINDGSRIWIGYVDSQGHATSRILEPARMEGGYLTAYDETRGAVHRFALHRITGVDTLT